MSKPNRPKRKYTKRSAFWTRKTSIDQLETPYPPTRDQAFLTLALDYGLTHTDRLLARIRAAARSMTK